MYGLCYRNFYTKISQEDFNVASDEFICILRFRKHEDIIQNYLADLYFTVVENTLIAI